MLKYILILLTFLTLQSCTTGRIIEVKSPCVSGEDGPCGPRRYINTWLNQSQLS